MEAGRKIERDKHKKDNTHRNKHDGRKIYAHGCNKLKQLQPVFFSSIKKTKSKEKRNRASSVPPGRYKLHNKTRPKSFCSWTCGVVKYTRSNSWLEITLEKQK